jgi:phosphoribosyl 1,2-cyclic phosphate phosphodiesterase
MGLDEVRRFNIMSGAPMPVYGDGPTVETLRRVFSYAFESDAPRGGGVPDLRLWTIGGAFCVGPQEIVPVPLRHGRWQILGFRFGRFAYLTDTNGVPAESMARLGGLDTVVLDALRHRPHPTHFTMAQAIEVARQIGARQTFFTHMAHDLGHAETCRTLPAGMALAHDGLVLEIG